MREEHELAEEVWYDTSTKVNNGERLFGVKDNVKQLEQVVNEARFLFDFELRGLKFNGAEVLFYIKPADGLKLPEIMQWIKQTFAVRFDRDHGRTGHIWGDRYQSEILPGEPPEWAEEYVFMAIDRPVRRGDWKRETARLGLGKRAGNANAANRAPDAEGRPRSRPDAEKTRVQADLPRTNGSRPA